MKKKSYFQTIIVFAIVLLIIIVFLQKATSISFVYAENDSTGGLVPCNNKCTLCHLLIGMQNIFKYLMGLLLVATMFFVVLNGVLMMASAGSKKIIGQVKTAFSYCLKGFLLFLVCWVIVTAILKTLGYKQLANWWQFECDTTQTKPPPVPVFKDKPRISQKESKSTDSEKEEKKKSCKDVGGICRVWNTSTEGQTKCEGEEQPQEYKCENSGEVCCVKAGKGCQGIVSNIMAMEGWKYTKAEDKHKRFLEGFGDCSSTTSRAYTRAGCRDPGQTTQQIAANASVFSGDTSSLKAGDALVWNNGKNGHVGICLDDGCTKIMGANSRSGIRPSAGGARSIMNQAAKNKAQIKVIRASDFCPPENC